MGEFRGNTEKHSKERTGMQNGIRTKETKNG